MSEYREVLNTMSDGSDWIEENEVTIRKALTLAAEIEENKSLKCFYTDKPSGNFLAIYSDLSGAEYFYQQEIDSWSSDNVGICDADWFTDAGFLWFIQDGENNE